MPSRADVDLLVDLNRTVRELITRDLTSFWESLDLGDPNAARDALLEFLPLLVAQYGDVTATVAADWYTDVRAKAKAPGKFAPTLAVNVAAEVVTQRARFGLGNLYTDEPVKALKFLDLMAGEYAARSGRNTILQSAHRDPWKPRVARVPSGATTCAFCLMLASRGAVYSSPEKAGKFDKFHGKCDCQIVMIGRNDSYPEGYDPDALYNQYQDARSMAAASDGDLNILQAFRRDGDSNVADAVHDHDH